MHRLGLPRVGGSEKAYAVAGGALLGAGLALLLSNPSTRRKLVDIVDATLKALEQSDKNKGS